ncbi:DUF5316 domain-containing protein [Sporolactobacillus shoreicorticis]|uniref:DUF5316 domain-containing protein n=1 Tax=Sporolactobacillus shoreicorticis TaxID=1923877 RepID=A0ABW5S2P2_9BACL|nr:DUF5316 domain-containing protein [Sporolactobacillus shoreicorticis]MCO7126523.1 DUF5316 domain-containing protein [Sporolactobacillus shoreicorticis]
MKLFSVGIIVGILLFLLGYYTPLHYVFIVVSGILGAGSLVISGMASGAFVSGDRNRANFAAENREERHQRISILKKLALFGGPIFASCIALIALTN